MFQAMKQRESVDHCYLAFQKFKIMYKLAIKHDLLELFREKVLKASLRSAPNHMPLTYYYCANNNNISIESAPMPNNPLVKFCYFAQNASGKSTCVKEGKLRCSGCFLVAYCSKECQLEHWPIHRVDCKSALMSDDWQPEWVQQR